MGWRNGAGILVALPFLVSCFFTPKTFDEEAWRRAVQQQDPQKLYAVHEEAGRFFNPWMPGKQGRFWEFIKWRLSASEDYTEEETSYLPAFVPGLAERISQLPASENFLVWIGHGTFLLRIDGNYWLTDPMLSDRALLPKRYTPPALTKKELAKLDGPVNVIISHNHYDHLDEDTVRALPPGARIFAPLGLGELLAELHEGPVIELDWWEKVHDETTTLTCLPAQHWSRRIGQGRNSTLWASFMLETPDFVVYYGGDSGYFAGYREFGKQFRDIDYALLPITAYRPRWFMHYPHINVAEALAAFDDLGASYFVPTQWGTFWLGDNPPGFPGLDLKRRLNDSSRDQKRYIRPDLGEIVILQQRDRAGQPDRSAQ